MTGVDLSPLAERDLDGILDYIAEHRPAAAIRVIRKLMSTCELLGRRPTLGPPCEDLSPGLRHFVVPPHVIYFRVLPSGVRVERVLHGARNARAEFIEADEEE